MVLLVLIMQGVTEESVEVSFAPRDDRLLEDVLLLAAALPPYLHRSADGINE